MASRNESCRSQQNLLLVNLPNQDYWVRKAPSNPQGEIKTPTKVVLIGQLRI